MTKINSAYHEGSKCFTCLNASEGLRYFCMVSPPPIRLEEWDITTNVRTVFECSSYEKKGGGEEQ